MNQMATARRKSRSIPRAAAWPLFLLLLVVAAAVNLPERPSEPTAASVSAAKSDPV